MLAAANGVSWSEGGGANHDIMKLGRGAIRGDPSFLSFLPLLLASPLFFFFFSTNLLSVCRLLFISGCQPLPSPAPPLEPNSPGSCLFLILVLDLGCHFLPPPPLPFVSARLFARGVCLLQAELGGGEIIYLRDVCVRPLIH